MMRKTASHQSREDIHDPELSILSVELWGLEAESFADRDHDLRPLEDLVLLLLLLLLLAPVATMLPPTVEVPLGTGILRNDLPSNVMSVSGHI